MSNILASLALHPIVDAPSQPQANGTEHSWPDLGAEFGNFINVLLIHQHRCKLVVLPPFLQLPASLANHPFLVAFVC